MEHKIIFELRIAQLSNSKKDSKISEVVKMDNLRPSHRHLKFIEVHRNHKCLAGCIYCKNELCAKLPFFHRFFVSKVRKLLYTGFHPDIFTSESKLYM